MNEIVVGIDGSDDSRRALAWAAEVARVSGAPLRVAQAWIQPRTALLPLGPDPLPAEALDEQAQRATEEFVADTLGTTVPARTEALRGMAAGALLKTVGPDDVLVLGSRGLGGFRGLLLGSVSQECVEYAPCPVVVVRTERVLGESETVLVGKDGSDGAHAALGWAHELAVATGAGLHAVHAWRSGASERPPHVADRLRSRAADAVRGWTQQLDDGVATDEVEGDPREVLVNAAERLDPSLLVLGRRGAGGVRSMRLGSTANHLIRQTACNVAVIPGPEG